MTLNIAPTQIRHYADAWVVLMAASLPWSTTLFYFFVTLWLASLLPGMNLRLLARVAARPESLFAISIFLLSFVGLSWANASASDAFNSLRQVLKLLAIPLLIYQFSTSQKTVVVLVSFLVSCALLLAVSWIGWLHPNWHFSSVRPPGVPVKTWITQGQEFAICALGCTVGVTYFWRTNRPRAAVLLALLGMAFLLNLTFVISSRTALVSLPFLSIILLARSNVGWITLSKVLITLAVCFAALWMSSNYLRERTFSITSEVSAYMHTHEATSAGQRLEFWKKSTQFIIDSPIIGNGTGSTRSLFESVAGGTGPSAIVVSNPHNQILNFGIQWGLIGVVLLIAMWVSHLRQFVAPRPYSIIGLLVVSQNVIGSAFNSHITDFAEGWLYVLAVGTLTKWIDHKTCKSKLETAACP